MEMLKVVLFADGHVEHQEENDKEDDALSS